LAGGAVCVLFDQFNQQGVRVSYETKVKTQSISAASILAASFLTLGCLAMDGSVQAAEPRYDRAIVAYGDLNLDSEQGAKALYARLRNGAEDVCSSFEGRDLAFKKLWQSCFDSAVASAVAQINRTGLTTLHTQTVSRSKRYR
jgi:UrcA family protein